MARSLVVTGIVLYCVSASQVIADVQRTDWMSRGSSVSSGEHTIESASLIDMRWLRFQDQEYSGRNQRSIGSSERIVDQFKETVTLASVHTDACPEDLCNGLGEKDIYRRHYLDFDSSTMSSNRDAYEVDIINSGLTEERQTICSRLLCGNFLNDCSDIFQQNYSMNVEFGSNRWRPVGSSSSRGYGFEPASFVLLLIGVGVPVALRQLLSR